MRYIIVKLYDDVSHHIIKHLDIFEAERVAVMQKTENLILQSKTAVVDSAKRELSSGLKPIGLVFGAVIWIDSHRSSRRLEEKVTNVHEIVTVLSGNVTNVHEIVTMLSGNVTNVHSSLGDEIAKLTEEVSKLSMLISKEPPNLELGRKMDAYRLIFLDNT